MFLCEWALRSPPLKEICVLSERELVNRACGLVRTRQEIVERNSLLFLQFPNWNLCAFWVNSFNIRSWIREFLQKAEKEIMQRYYFNDFLKEICTGPHKGPHKATSTKHTNFLSEIVEIISLHYFLSAFCKNSLIKLRILKEFTQKTHKFPLGNCRNNNEFLSTIS